MSIALLSKDLLFISRVKEVAAALSGEAVCVKNEGQLIELLAVSGPPQGGVMLIDLEKSPVSLEVLGSLLTEDARQRWRCIAFYSHVHHETALRARAIGIEEVIPRSKFVQLLPTLFSA